MTEWISVCLMNEVKEKNSMKFKSFLAVSIATQIDFLFQELNIFFIRLFRYFLIERKNNQSSVSTMMIIVLVIVPNKE